MNLSVCTSNLVYISSCVQPKEPAAGHSLKYIIVNQMRHCDKLID